jgi:hypothetical protein
MEIQENALRMKMGQNTKGDDTPSLLHDLA